MVLTGSNDPDASYHGGLLVSRHLRIDAPLLTPDVAGQRRGVRGYRRREQSIAQPLGILLRQAQDLSKHPNLVTAPGMRWAQAVIPDFCNVDDRESTMRQAAGHVTAQP